MALPQVTITEQDGALGVQSSSGGKILAIIGYTSTGTANVPTGFGRTKDVVSAFGQGPGVEAACLHIERTGRSVVLVRAAAATGVGVYGTVTFTGTGTSVVTGDATLKPNGDYEIALKVITGGTVGTAGIVVQTSLDGGRNYSANIALGTANNIAFADGNVKLGFAAGTLVAGDLVTCRTTAPAPTAVELGAAFDALNASNVNWELVEFAGVLDATLFDTMETKTAARVALGKPACWIGNARMPNAGETEAAYKTAIDLIFTSKATVYGGVCYGAAKVISSATSGRKYKMPIVYSVASRLSHYSIEQNAGAVKLGALPGVSIRDDNGNPDEHDELINPGADDSRFITLRSYNGRGGAFITRPRILCNPGSDYQIFPYRRVINAAEETVRSVMEMRLNDVVFVNAKTGYILEKEAKDIETSVSQSLAGVLAGKASGWSVALSRTDNILSTKTLTMDVRVIPVGYAEFITITIGFVNPALQVVKA